MTTLSQLIVIQHHLAVFSTPLALNGFLSLFFKSKSEQEGWNTHTLTPTAQAMAEKH